MNVEKDCRALSWRLTTMYTFAYNGEQYTYNTYRELCEGMFYGLCDGCKEEAETEGIEMSLDQMLMLGCYIDCASWGWTED